MNKILGLSDIEVKERIKNKQINYEVKATTKGFKQIVFKNVFNLFNFLNFLIMLLVIITGKYENMLFMGVVCFNSAIAIYQETKANKLLDKLKILNKPQATVIRNEKEEKIKSDEIVIDDILKLKEGDEILSDCILIEGEVDVNESILTGESLPIKKIINEKLFAGSYITSGIGYAKVIAVNKDNYANKLLLNISYYKKTKSKIRDGLNFIIKMISTIIIPLALILFIKLQYFNQNNFEQNLLQVCASMIGMIPEGLILLSSVALYIASIKLTKINCLVNDMFSIETLARINCLCLDKTGTLTNGQMEVVKVINSKEDQTNLIGQIVNTINDQNFTAQALKKYFTNQEKIEYEKIINFNSKNKYSCLKTKNETYYLGAYEFLKHKDVEIEKTINQYANKGYRVICFENEKEILSLIIIQDQLRKGIIETLKYFKKQGINIKIISGDNLKTVLAIAKKCGLENLKGVEYGNQEINNLTSYDVFARVTPELKLDIIRQLKKENVVAMVGDGINDVLALKEADFSIGLEKGVEASKKLANIVLLDNDFSKLNEVVNKGRFVINNITKQASLFITKTIFSIIITFLSLFLFKKYPFIPIQLTIISSLCIGFPSFILTFKPNYEPIKKGFLSIILKQSLPYGISICTIICIIYFVDFHNFQTISFVSTFILMVIILIESLKPLQKLEILLIIIAIFGFISINFLLNQYIAGLIFNIETFFVSGLYSIIGTLLAKIMKKRIFKDSLYNQIEKYY